MAPSTALPHRDWVEVGYLLRPHGVRGELRVILHAPEEGFPKSIETVRLVHPKHGEKTAKVASARKSKGAILMTLDSIAGRDEAQHWKGSALFVDASHLPEPEQGYHVYELVGTHVTDQHGQPRGQVSGFLDNSAHFILQIDERGNERLLPYVDDFIASYDRDSDTLHVIVPEGLWEDAEEPK